MRALQDLVKDEVFVIGRLRELTNLSWRVYLCRPNPPETMAYESTGRQAVRIITLPSKRIEGVQSLVVQVYGRIPSNDLVLEVLNQLESLKTLRDNYRPPHSMGRYHRYCIYYK